MGKFKYFIEQTGLGNLGSKINQMANSQWLDDSIGGAFTTSDVSGSEQMPPQGYAGQYPKPEVDLTIPSVQRTGRIISLMKKKNPIYVRLSDGTDVYFSFDEFKRIQGTPAIGKVMTVIFQRDPSDITQDRSKIDKAIVH